MRIARDDSFSVQMHPALDLLPVTRLDIWTFVGTVGLSSNSICSLSSVHYFHTYSPKNLIHHAHKNNHFSHIYSFKHTKYAHKANLHAQVFSLNPTQYSHKGRKHRSIKSQTRTSVKATTFLFDFLCPYSNFN